MLRDLVLGWPLCGVLILVCGLVCQGGLLVLGGVRLYKVGGCLLPVLVSGLCVLCLVWQFVTLGGFVGGVFGVWW